MVFFKQTKTPVTVRNSYGVAHFAPIRPGPESGIVSSLSKWWPKLCVSKFSCWAGSSFTLGAGQPDLVVVSYRPEIRLAKSLGIIHVKVLSYLRSVSYASYIAVIENTGLDKKVLDLALEKLLRIKAISQIKTIYRATPEWRDILPEVISIEAKVDKWKVAATQADRNRTFARHSYVALPYDLARRISCHPVFLNSRLGVLGINKAGKILVLRRAIKGKPLIWDYYYQLALAISRNMPRGESCHTKSQ